MIGVTIFGLLFTPTFYVVCRWFASKLARKPKVPEPAQEAVPATGSEKA